MKDAGDGFDMEAIPGDRHGLRNSILGRVARVGGKVEVRFLPPVEVSPWSVPEAGGAPNLVRIPSGLQNISQTELGLKAHVFLDS